MSEPCEVEVGGVRLPYLVGHRSDYGITFRTTGEAARMLESVVGASSQRGVMLRAPDRSDALAEVGNVSVETIALLPGGQAEIRLRFRP